MLIVAFFCVDKRKYEKSKHRIVFKATEYDFGTDLLIQLFVGQNIGTLPSDLSRHISGREEYFHWRADSSGGKQLNSDTFSKTKRRLDMERRCQADVSHEIVEFYSYIDKKSRLDVVRIIIREKSGKTTAEVEFTSAEQHKCFFLPPWLRPLNGSRD